MKKSFLFLVFVLCGISGIAAAGGEDLAVNPFPSGEKIILSRDDPRVGDGIAVLCGISNLGAGEATGKVSFYDNGEKIGAFPLQDLLPGAGGLFSQVAYAFWHPLTEGAHLLKVEVEIGGNLLDGNEKNNQARLFVNVEGVTREVEHRRILKNLLGKPTLECREKDLKFVVLDRVSWPPDQHPPRPVLKEAWVIASIRNLGYGPVAVSGITLSADGEAPSAPGADKLSPLATSDSSLSPGISGTVLFRLTPRKAGKQTIAVMGEKRSLLSRLLEIPAPCADQWPVGRK
ncbi:MAG: hypothetical protein HYU64_01800 [Armatimonadetes bacterium]|nr:hypothetical protein [Armatimonadota bacterium]